MGLDLVDTVWRDNAVLVDQFDDPEGVRAWLADHDLPGDPGRVRDPLVHTRDAMRALLERGEEGPLNEVLGRGARRPLLRDGEPYEIVVLDNPDWHAAWVAAADLVRVLGERRERVRKCANPRCVLWFYDQSKNGGRRWCSMEVCGNRAKVSRFHQRHRSRL